MIKLLLLALAGAWGAQAWSGTITGTVKARGKAGADAANPGGGKYESHEFKFVERVNYEDMRDFVVYVDGPVGPKPDVAPAPAQITTRRITQKGAVFEPHVLPIMQGTTVDWPNNDDILHNVFSYSESNPFDLGLYKAPVVKHVPFDKSGRVDVFCSIHTRMSCVVLVLENPYFAKANPRGAYTITNVPPGSYTLKAWHERLPIQSRRIIVPELGEVKEDFTLGIQGLPER